MPDHASACGRTGVRPAKQEERDHGAVGQGAAFAGAAARGDDPSFLAFNPASMAWLSGTQLSVVGSGLFPQTEARSGSASRAAVLGGSPITGSLGGDAAVDAFLPALHATTELGRDLHLGLSVTTP